MRGKPSFILPRGWRKCAAFIMVIVLLAALAACSGSKVEVSPTPFQSLVWPTMTATPEPVIVPTDTPEPSPTLIQTPRPTIAVSFPPIETDASGAYVYPQVVADKSSALTGEPVNFRVITSDKVNKIQTIIDGDPGKTYTEYQAEGSVRVWRVTIHFVVGGSRKVQFKCSMASGGTAMIPSTPIKINVTFNYTAESTSGTITKGKTVTFTLKTPDTIDYIYVVVDGVNQNIKYTEPASDEDGVKVWKINVTFFGLGDRLVTFEAYDGTKLKATFPERGIAITVVESVG